MSKVKKCIAGFSTISLCSCIGYSSFVISEEEKTIDFSFDPYVCFIDSTYYTSIEEALLNSHSGDVVQVIPGNKNRNSSAYTITTNSPSKKVVIPEGVTLNIPYELGVQNNKKADSIDGAHALANRNKYCMSSVILGKGITLENRGTIEIGGIIGAKGGGQPTGCTAGNYSELILGENSLLTNYGTLNVFGYIGETVDGSAHIISRPMNNQIVPTINMPMYWYDFGGGSALKAIYDAIDEYKCLPLDDFYFENIEVEFDIYGGTEIYTWVNLYAASNYGEYDLPLIGTDDNFLINLPQNSYLKSNFDSSTLLHYLDFYGDVKINDFTIDVKKAITDTAGSFGWLLAAAAGLPSKVSSSKGYFPISYHYQISLNSLNNQPSIVDGSKNRFKFLNGSSLKISENVSLNTKEAIFYKGDDIFTGRGTHAKSLTKSKSVLSPSSAVINGKISAEVIAGTITTETKDATLLATASTSITMYEPKAGEGSNTSSKMLDGEAGWFYLPLSLKLMNSQGEYEERDLGKYVSANNNDIYYRNKYESSDLSSVSIISENGTSTDAGKSKSFNLSLLLTPENYTSEILSYEWSVVKNSSVGEEASLSATNESTTTLTIPANSSETDDAFYAVTVKVKYISSEDNLKHEITNTLSFTSVKKESSETGVCLLPYTKILMNDLTWKYAKDLNNKDEILTYNHFLGRFESQKVIFSAIYKGTFDIIDLYFEFGVHLKVATGHGLFNLTHYKYEIYYGNEFLNHIGESFAIVKILDGIPKILSAKLLKVEIYEEETVKYSPLSEYNVNCISDDVLSIPDDIEGMFDGFVFTKNNLQIDMHKFNELVNRLGVYDYNEVNEVLPKYIFDVFNFKYFKAFINGGYFTCEKVNYWLDKYGDAICDFHDIKFDFKSRKKLK